MDAEGGSPSSAALGPQLKGAWGSGSIASRLAQVQKGERPRTCSSGLLAMVMVHMQTCLRTPVTALQSSLTSARAVDAVN